MQYKMFKDLNKEIDGVMHKYCRDCEKWLVADLKIFGKDKNKKDGLNIRCRECNKKHHQNQYINNSDKYIENVKEKILNNELYNSVFNDYIIEGDITKIIMRTIDDNEVITCINTTELERVKSFGLRWCIKNSECTQSQYARATKWEMVNDKPKLVTYCLHILIMNAKKTDCVHHKNHNTLDNTNDNLEIISRMNNSRDRKSKNSNNKSGYRNVFWDSKNEMWRVTLCINYKSIYIGSFHDVHEAGKVAEEARQKYYGKYKGKS